MKKFYIALVTLIFLVVDCINISHTCNAKINRNSASESNNTISTDRLKRIKEKGVLTIVSANNPPYCFLDPETGEVTGIDGDIITEAIKRLGVNKVKMKYAPLNEFFTEIQKDDEIDMIVAMYVTENRKKYVSFTHPWYKNHDIFVVPKLSKLQFEEDLKDAVVAVQSGTVDVPFVEKLKQEGKVKDFISFLDQPEIFEAVNSGKVDAGISDIIIFPYLLKQNGRLHLRALYQDPVHPEIPGESAAGIRHEDTNLLNAVNEQIDEMKRDKTFSRILKKYGVDESSIIPPPPYTPIR